MSFGQEMKDFAEGFKTGFTLVEGSKERKWRSKEAEITRSGLNSEKDLDKFNKDKEGFGQGANAGGKEPRSTSGRHVAEDAKAAGKERYDYLIKLGVPPNLASGMVGNAYAESAFNTGAAGDNGSAHGEFQWRGDRWTNLKNYAAKNKMDPYDWKTQYGFAWNETQSLPAYKAMAAAKDPRQAADLFALHFERPKGAETGDASNIHQIDNRRNYAQNFSYDLPGLGTTQMAGSGEGLPHEAIPAEIHHYAGADGAAPAAAPAAGGQQASLGDTGASMQMASLQPTETLGGPDNIDFAEIKAPRLEDEENTVFAAEGGVVPPPSMRAFTQAVPGDPNAPGASTWQPRRVGSPSPGTAIPSPTTGAQQRFRDMLAARKAAQTQAPGNTPPDPGAFGPQAYAAYLADWHTKNKEREASPAYVSHGFGGMNHGQFTESTNMPARKAITAPTYGQWMTTQPGYGEWVKSYQKPGAPAAVPAFAEGGLVDPTKYRTLDPGSGPLNEGTAAQWRIDAALGQKKAQKAAQERIVKRDKVYHARPAKQVKRNDPEETGAVGGKVPVGTGGAGKPGELGTPNEATLSPPGKPPGTPGAGKPGELGTPNQAIPVTSTETPRVEAPTPPAATTTVTDAMDSPPVPGQEVEYAPYGGGTGDNSTTAAYQGSRPPDQTTGLGGKLVSPTWDQKRQMPIDTPVPPGTTVAAYQGSNPPEPPGPTPPGGPPPSPNSTVEAYPGSTEPARVSNPYVVQAIPAGPATPNAQPPLIRRTDQPPIPPREPNPQVAQAIPAGPATPAVQPPLIRRTDQPPIPPRPHPSLAGEGNVPPTLPVAQGSGAPSPGSSGPATHADVSPEPWIPQNVPEAAQGTLSQAWQYGRALLNAPAIGRKAAEALFNDTLVRAMKLGTPHSVIAAYADNFGTVAPGNPKKALGFAAGGAVPELDDEEYTPANQEAAANDQPIIPAGSRNLRAATPEAEGRAKGNALVSRDEARESTHAGLKYINDVLLTPKPKAAVGQDPAQQDAQQSFDTGSHALTSQEVQQLGQQVDPDNKLSQSEKVLKIQQDTYDWYMANGYPEKAAGAAASVLMYGRRVSQVSGNMAIAALESGRPDAMMKAAEFMKRAYETMPDGKELKVDPGPNGTLHYQIVDMDSGEVEKEGDATKDDMISMAQGMANGSEWARQTVEVAQGTVGIEGGTSGGTGRGSRTRHTPGGPSASAEANAKKEEARTSLNEAGRAYMADPSEENKQKYYESEDAATNAGVAPSMINLNRKRFQIDPKAEKPGGTQTEREDKADDANLQKQTTELDSQIETEKDPTKKAQLTLQRSTLPLDDGFNRAAKRNKNQLSTTGIDVATADMEEEDAAVVTSMARQFIRANNVAGADAGEVLKAAINPLTPMKIVGNQLQIGNQGSYFVSGSLFTQIMKMRRDAAKKAAPAAAAG